VFRWTKEVRMISPPSRRWAFGVPIALAAGKTQAAVDRKMISSAA
jgi:hypothetical protein